MAGLYIHVPFCRQACYYCDFHFSTNLSQINAYIQSIIKELSIRSDYLGKTEIETIYFGGGTPSLLDISALDDILQSVSKHYKICENPEITIESNPDDITPGKAADLRKIGFNRISIGLQSFNDGLLKYLNRIHDKEEAIRSFETVRKAGFDNVNIDLIFSIHPDTSTIWQKDLNQAIEIHPEHISAYNLTIESKTVFGNWHNKGKIEETGEEESAQQYEKLMNELGLAGYDQYEISNFALPGFQSQHNTNYWKGRPYIGVGPGAHSYNLISRQFNIINNAKYIRSLESGIVPEQKIELSGTDRINEFILTNLRTKWGISLKELREEYSYDLYKSKEPVIQSLSEHYFILLDAETIKLTQKGKLLADRIASDLFIT